MQEVVWIAKGVIIYEEEDLLGASFDRDTAKEIAEENHQRYNQDSIPLDWAEISESEDHAFVLSSNGSIMYDGYRVVMLSIRGPASSEEAAG